MNKEIKLKIKGIKGDTPTNEQLVELIKPLIPEPLVGEKGDTGPEPTDEKLVSLITPLIPEPKHGETPSDEKLIGLIKPLIVLPEIQEQVEETPDTLVTKVNKSKLKIKKNIIDVDWDEFKNKETTVEDVKGLPETIRQLQHRAASYSQVHGGGTNILLKTNDTANPVQTELNLKAGTNVTLTPDAYGAVTINSSGGGTTPSLQAVTDIGATTTNNITASALETTGAGTRLYNNGIVKFHGGDNTSPEAGSLQLNGGILSLGDTVNSKYVSLSFSANANSTARTYTLKDADGTLAFMSDIVPPSQSLQDVTDIGRTIDIIDDSFAIQVRSLDGSLEKVDIGNGISGAGFVNTFNADGSLGTNIEGNSISTNKVLVNTTDDGTGIPLQVTGVQVGPNNVVTASATKTTGTAFPPQNDTFNFKIFAYKDYGADRVYSKVENSPSLSSTPAGYITGISIFEPGAGYMVGDIVTVNGGNNDGTLTISGVDGVLGSISGYNLTYGGSGGYSVSDVLTGLSGDYNATFEVLAVDGSGVITDLGVISAGSGYSNYSTVSFDIGDAYIDITGINFGTPLSADITDPGTAYSIGTWSTSYGGGGGGFTVEITSVDPGSDYSIDVSWTAVTGADGYKTLISDTYNSYTYNKSYSTTSNSFNYTGSGLSTDVNTYPRTEDKSAFLDGSLTLGGNLNLGGFNISSGTVLEGTNSIGGGAGINSFNAIYSNFFGNYAGNNSLNAYSSNFFGNYAGYQASAAGNSNFFGSEAGYGATNAYSSIFMGAQAGKSASNANGANFFGPQSGYQATTAQYSNFFGSYAGAFAINAYSSNFFGANAGTSATSAFASNFFGNYAGYQATNASRSNFFGNQAGQNATNASNSNFFGNLSGYQATGAQNSSFFGTAAGYQATGALESNFFGNNAGNGATNASYSNFFGSLAGSSATNAKNSIFLGTEAGRNDTVNNTTTGYWSVAIGPYSGTGGFSNSMAFGRGVKNSATQEVNIGNVLYLDGIYNSDTQSSAPVTGAKIRVAYAGSKISLAHEKNMVFVNDSLVSNNDEVVLLT